MMYGLPGSLIQFGVKRAKQKPGRKSAQAQFLEQQRDLFPVDLYTSKLTAQKAPLPMVCIDAEGAAGDPATMHWPAQKLYVPVTRKVSATDDSGRVPEEANRTKLVREVSPEIGTRTRKVSLISRTKYGDLGS